MEAVLDIPAVDREDRNGSPKETTGFGLAIWDDEVNQEDMTTCVCRWLEKAPPAGY